MKKRLGWILAFLGAATFTGFLIYDSGFVVTLLAYTTTAAIVGFLHLVLYLIDGD